MCEEDIGMTESLPSGVVYNSKNPVNDTRNLKKSTPTDSTKISFTGSTTYIIVELTDESTVNRVEFISNKDVTVTFKSVENDDDESTTFTTVSIQLILLSKNLTFSFIQLTLTYVLYLRDKLSKVFFLAESLNLL